MLNDGNQPSGSFLPNGNWMQILHITLPMSHFSHSVGAGSRREHEKAASGRVQHMKYVVGVSLLLFVDYRTLAGSSIFNPEKQFRTSLVYKNKQINK